MKSLSVFVRDMKAIVKKPMVLVSFIAVAFVPILYSGVLLTASWDPYGHLDQLPVAVVNLDKGAPFEGERLQAGTDFAGELKKNHDFDWQFVSSGKAQDGMEHNKYYMTITIPDDFSAKATTLMDNDPQPADLLFEPNGDYNFIGGQIGKSAIKDIKAQISAKVTEAYTKSMFDQLAELSGGLSQAGSGAAKLEDGAGELAKGTAILKQNLQKYAAATLQTEEGAKPLLDGAAKLKAGASALNGGAADLTSGLKQLTAAEQKLQAGSAQSEQGAGKLEAGLQASSEGVAKLQAGLRSSADGSAALAGGLNASVAGSGKVADGAKGVADGLEQLGKANAELAKSPAFQQLLAASREVAAGSGRLHESQQQLAAGGAQLQQGLQQLEQGGGELAGTQQRLQQGAAQLQAGQAQLTGGLAQLGGKLAGAAAGSAKMAGGAQQLGQGAAQLQGGLARLAGGVSSLQGGAGQLTSGAAQLQDGAAKLASGSAELAGKLSAAAGKSAAVKATDKTVSMFAEPVHIVENNDHKVDKYGAGIAPYFISLGLFVGALIFTTIFSARETTVPGATGFGRFVSRTLTFVTISVLQSCIAVLILLFGIHLEVQSMPMFFLLLLVTSLAFSFIIQMLVTWLDQPGRFLAVLVMILQLTASAGTFPLELLPAWMKPVHPWLPMTHSIDGFKAAISSGDLAAVWHQIGVLSIYATVAVALTLLYFLRQRQPKAAAAELT